MVFSRPLRYCVGGGAAPGYQICAARVFALPQREATLAQKIFVIQLQFFQAGAGHIGEFQFGLFRSACCLTSLCDVLHSTAGRLHHLVMRATALANVAITKAHSDVIHQLRDLKTLQLAVAAMLWDQGFFFRHFLFRHSLSFCGHVSTLSTKSTTSTFSTEG